MTKKYSFLLLLILFVVGCTTQDSDTSLNVPPIPSVELQEETPSITVENSNVNTKPIIEMNNDGFSPDSLTVNTGDTVTFVNKGTIPRWPASDVHPTHRNYPGSDIKKCRSDEKNKLFDSCGKVEPGSSWSFKFTEKGIWKYHDHLSASKVGTIIVN